MRAVLDLSAARYDYVCAVTDAVEHSKHEHSTQQLERRLAVHADNVEMMVAARMGEVETVLHSLVTEVTLMRRDLSKLTSTQ